MVGREIHHYRVIRQLGAGGMGIVFEAEDTRLGRHVAIKCLPPSAGLDKEAVERFEREARIASSINHPNICTIYDVGVFDGQPFLVMELIEGASLRGKIHGQPLPLELTLDLGCQIADALDVAHAKGIVHRDVKPANIYITKRGQAKLLDFGIAKLTGDHHGEADDDETRVGADVLTMPGVAVGSVNYMSPEQARGEDLDGRTDLFSLGVVLYEMVTGRQAFAGQTSAVVFDAILNRQPIDPRQLNAEVPDELLRVIARSLEKDRRLRFQTAADMLAELGRVRRDTSGRTAAAVVPATTVVVAAPTAATTVPIAVPTAATVPAPAAPPTAATRPRPRWTLVGGAVLAVAIVAGYFVWLRPVTPALGQRDMVLVADFANSTGDVVFDQALREAVAVQLQQTPFVTLLPDQRVQRTLRLMKRGTDEPVTGEVAREVCQRAGAKATVEGSIASLGSSFVISLGVHNCQTGELLASSQAQASTKEEVLKALGTALTTLRERLGESLSSIKKYDVAVGEATTSSLEALRSYGQGLRARVTKGDEASIPFFKQAIEKDPMFALAYAKLGVVAGNLGKPADAREMALKAYELRDKVSEYERLYITWNHAARVLQSPKAVRESLELLTASYPRDFAARNNFGVYYNGQGEFAKALEQYKAAMEIAPDEPGPISNASYVAFFLGQHDEACALVARALAIRPDANLAITRWAYAARAGDPRAGEYEQVAVKLASEDQVQQTRAGLALWRGQLAAYDRIVDSLKARARAAKNTDGVLSLDLGQLMSHTTFGDPKSRVALAGLVKTVPYPAARTQMAAVLAIAGDVAPARAQLPDLEKEAAANPALRASVALLQAYVKADEGHADEAVGILEAALAEQPRAQDLHYVIGQLKSRAGDTDGAIASYQALLKAEPQLGANFIVSLGRLKLAELLVKKGDRAGAKREYDVLLAQWKEADTEFDALKELKKQAGQMK